MSKAGMAVLAAWIVGAMTAMAGVAVMSLPLLQGSAQPAPPAGAELMHGSQPLVPPGKVRIAGEVAALAAGDYLQAVELRIGTEVIPVYVQGQQWEATVFLTDAGRMVSVEARSTKGRQSSLLGSLSRLAGLAGGDGRLDVQEHAALRVSSLTTALARHIEYALDRQPATDLELDQTTRAVGHDGLGALSYALVKIAAGELPLPAGYQDGYAFSANRDAFKAWPHLPAYQAWSAYVFEHEWSPYVTDLAELPSRMLMLGGLSVTQYPGYTGTTRLLERTADGSVNFHEDRPLANPNYSIALDGAGRIVLAPRAPVIHQYERAAPYNDVIQRTSQGHVLRRMVRSGGISVWAVRSDWLDVNMSSPSSPPVPVTEYRVLSATDLDSWVRTDAWPFNSWQYTLPWLCIEPGQLLAGQLAICGYPLQSFDWWDGKGSALEQGMPLTVDGVPTVPDGSTRFDFANDNQTRLTINNGVAETHFWRLQAGTVGRAVVPAVFLSRSLQGETQGQTLVRLTPSFLHQFENYQPSVIQPLGSWRNGYQVAQAPSYVGLDVSVTLSRVADGNSSYSVQGDNGNSVESHRWSMTGFGIYNIRANARYPDGSNRQVDGCTPSVIAAGATSCSALVRYFRPITLARGSYYGVEERYQVRYPDPDGSGGSQARFAITRDYSRLGFEMCESDECISVFPKAEQQASLTPSASAGPLPSGRVSTVEKPRRTPARISVLLPRRDVLAGTDDRCTTCLHDAAALWLPTRKATPPEEDGDVREQANDPRKPDRRDEQPLTSDDASEPVRTSRPGAATAPARTDATPRTRSTTSSS